MKFGKSTLKSFFGVIKEKSEVNYCKMFRNCGAEMNSAKISHILISNTKKFNKFRSDIIDYTYDFFSGICVITVFKF